MKKSLDFDVVIKPSESWFDFRFRELLKYKDLLFLFVKRDFVVTHAQSILGPLWYLVTPIVSTLVYVVVFGKIAQIPTDGLPPALFYLSGITIWNYFSGCTGKTQDVLYLNSSLFGRIYFPRLIVPLSYLISALVPYLSQLITLIGMFLFHKYYMGIAVQLSWKIMFLPILLVFSAMLSLGIGLIVSSLSFRYRDFVHVSGFFMSMLMYASPVVYPASRIPTEWHWAFFLNPVATLIECYRNFVFGVGAFPHDRVLLSAFMILVIFLTGMMVFNRVEKSFIDTI